MRMADPPDARRPLRPRWRVERHAAALIALSALEPACSARARPEGELSEVDYRNEYSPASDPVSEPARLAPAPEFTVETAWLNGRQLVVHVTWKPGPEGPRSELPYDAKPSATPPIFTVGGQAPQVMEGTVPHLAPSAVAAPEVPAPPGDAVVKPTVVQEKFGSEPDSYWFLVRGLSGPSVIEFRLLFDTAEGPLGANGRLLVEQVGGRVVATLFAPGH